MKYGFGNCGFSHELDQENFYNHLTASALTLLLRLLHTTAALGLVANWMA